MYSMTSTATGGRDGVVNIYRVTLAKSRKLGTYKHQIQAHDKKISGIKIIPAGGNPLVVSCGNDNKIVGVDMNR
jgi:WD40 repeat protein